MDSPANLTIDIPRNHTETQVAAVYQAINTAVGDQILYADGFDDRFEMTEPRIDRMSLTQVTVDGSAPFTVYIHEPINIIALEDLPFPF